MRTATRNIKNMTFDVFGHKGYDFLRLLNRIRKLQFHVRDFNDEIFAFHKKLCNDDSIMLDIGSNRGFFTFHYSKIAKNGFVYSFEPIPSTFKLQKKLLKFFRINNYKAFNLALGDKAGSIEMLLPRNGHFPEDLCATIKTENVEKSFTNFEIIKTECDTLNNIIAKEKIKRIDFIKMDVEGAEFLVLKGAEKALNLRPIIFMEMIDRHFKKFGYQKEDIITFLKNMNFDPMFYDDVKSLLIPFEINGKGNDALDMYFIPEERMPLLLKKNLLRR